MSDPMRDSDSFIVEELIETEEREGEGVHPLPSVPTCCRSVTSELTVDEDD